MSKELYQYRVPFKRTANWWAGDGNGDWAKLSAWCNQMFGKGNWDYFYDGFVFEQERDYMLFKLKWGDDAY